MPVVSMYDGILTHGCCLAPCHGVDHIQGSNITPVPCPAQVCSECERVTGSVQPREEERVEDLTCPFPASSTHEDKPVFISQPVMAVRQSGHTLLMCTCPKQ